MVNVNKLRGKMVEYEYNVERLANETNIDKAKLYRRFQNPEEFTIREANQIINILNLTPDEIIAIFFSKSVA